MRYAQIRPLDITNGEGTGMALFVQGCHFHCKDCFNKETWDFNGGKEWTQEIEKKFIELAGRPHIKRVSFLGGEPLARENVQTIYNLIRKLKILYPEIKIWLYTGYTIEEIFGEKNIVGRTCFDIIPTIRRSVIQDVDILCDGTFISDKKDPLNKEVKWVGSTNQRVIDVKKSLYSASSGKYLKDIVLYEN